MAGSSAQVTWAFLAKDLASGTIRGISKSFKNLKENAKNLGGALKTGLKIGVGAIAALGAGAIAAAVDFTRAAISDEAANNRLISILKQRKLASEANLKVVDQLIAKGAELAFTDDEVRAGLATATQFTKKFTDAQKILAVAQDLARAKNISLEEATSIVGKAYQGNTKGLKALGVETKKGAKGLAVLTAVSAKFGKSAAAYAETTEGKFAALKIAIDETRESVGYVFLNALKRVFGALQPYVMKFLSEIQKRLPDLEKFVNKIADDLIKNLPGYIATAKKELPILIDKLKSFFNEALQFGKDAAKFLGKDGAVTGGLALIGAKIGGLKGALGGVLTKAFSDVGFGPFQSLLLGTVSSAVIAGMTEGLVGAATQKLLATFAGNLKAASTVTPTLGGAGGLGLGAAALPVTLVALSVAAAAALSDAITSKGMTNKVGGNNVIDIFGTTAATTAPQGFGDFGDFINFILTGKQRTSTTYTGGNVGTSYGAPNLTVYVGATSVAEAVVPILGRNVGTSPRGGR